MKTSFYSDLLEPINELIWAKDIFAEKAIFTGVLKSKFDVKKSSVKFKYHLRLLCRFMKHLSYIVNIQRIWRDQFHTLGHLCRGLSSMKIYLLWFAKCHVSLLVCLGIWRADLPVVQELCSISHGFLQNQLSHVCKWSSPSVVMESNCFDLNLPSPVSLMIIKLLIAKLKVW